jgi:hypothetical protein
LRIADVVSGGICGLAGTTDEATFRQSVVRWGPKASYPKECPSPLE